MSKHFPARRGIMLACMCLAASAHAAPLKKTLHSFQDNPDGSQPFAALTQLASGLFVGTTLLGGDSAGTVYRMTPKGATTVLHTFARGGATGKAPASAITVGSDGAMYGMTSSGGDAGFGTIFKLKNNGSFTVLHSFAGTDGANPYGPGLIEGNDGALYGVAWAGGTYQAGTIFRVTKAGKFKVLHQFAFDLDGGRPSGGLVRRPDGFIHGLTSGSALGGGTLFKFDETGNYAMVATFPINSQPSGALAVDAQGNLYGTTRQGGESASGTVFKFDSVVGLTTLVTFRGPGDPVGFYPQSGLTLATDGRLYGSTFGGGANLSGSIFRITIAGSIELVYSFVGFADGSNPEVPLIAATDGSIYGVMEMAGDFNHGYAYRLKAAVSAPIPEVAARQRELDLQD